MSRPRRSAAKPQPRAEQRTDAILDPTAASFGPAGSSALYNPETGHGIAGRDTGVAYRWRSPRRLSDLEIEAITVDGIGRRGIAIRGWEATRQWGKVQAPRSPLDAAATAQIVQWLEQRAEHLHLRTRIADLQRERERWGDAALVTAVGVDPATWREAVDPSADVDVVRVRSLRVLRGRDKDYRPTALHSHNEAEWGEVSEIAIRTMALPANPEDEFRYGSMNLGRNTRGEVKIHASRFHILRTIDGRSDLDGVNQRLAELLAAARGAARIAARPAIPYIEGRNIGAQLRANRDRARGMYGQAHAEADEGTPLLMDLAANEKAGYVGPPGGLSVVEPITGLGFMLSAAWGIPMTLLFGMSPSGLGGDGSSERDNWHNVVRKVQAELEPAVLEVYRALAIELAANLRALARQDSIAGRLDLAAERLRMADVAAKLDLRFSWAPLRVLDAIEEAEYRLKTAQWQTAYLDKNVIRADEIRASVFGGESFAVDVSTVDKGDADKVQKSIPVGTAQAALAVLIASAAGQISGDTAKAMLVALDPSFTTVAGTLPAGATATNPVAAPSPAAPTSPLALDEPTLEPMWTEPEIRDALRVGKRTVARWVEEGKLRAFDAGNGRRRYRKAEVVALYNGDPEAQQEAEAADEPIAA